MSRPQGKPILSQYCHMPWVTMPRSFTKAKGGTRDYGVMSASAISYITGAAHKIPHFGWRADRPCGEGDGEVRHLLRRCLGGGLAQQGAVVSKGASGRADA